MRRNRKILDEARADVAVVVAPVPPQKPRRRRRKVDVGASLHVRREVLRQMAPKYREASWAHKRVVLEDFARLTSYHRTYAMWLLKHADEGQSSLVHPPRRVYQADVEEALVLIWTKTNRLCAKRLIPSLSMFLDSLERHDHLHLTPECRTQLLSMSVATADRLLRPHRQQELRGLCTTRAGTLLKSTIPIRTFEQWDEQVPGFIEADLVAHCGSSVEGSYLFTLTLTDIATGWTECLPLHTKSAEAVLAALQCARQLFPFPLLGLDTDNGTEFINDLLVSYCEAEHITFTRGRPALKNDQCYVEQKNGHIVRQVVGYDRFIGAQAYQHMDDLYRVLSSYVNFFQPSMKLCAKLKEGRKVRCIYDEAKTPLTRLLHAQVEPANHERDLSKQFEDLGPVRLLEQAQQAQQTLFRSATGVVLYGEKRRRLLACERFRVVGRSRLPSAADAVLRREFGTARGEEGQSATTSLLEWHRTCNDPFQEQWDLIAEWVSADPTRSCRAIFEELRRLTPDHYQPSHLRTLQRGVRKIRARLPYVDMQPRKNVRDAEVFTSLVSYEREETMAADSSTERSISTGAEESEQHDEANEQGVSALTCCLAVVTADDVFFSDVHDVRASVQEPVPEKAPHKTPPVHEEQMPDASLVAAEHSSEPTTSCKNPMSNTIEEAMGEYLATQQRVKRRPKTMEWHETALGLFGQYLRTEWEGILLADLREEHVHGWMQWLAVPTTMGIHRTEGTITTYTRSARAWCSWLVETGSLTRTPFARIHLSRGEPSVIEPLHQEQWQRLLHACQLSGESGMLVEWTLARNQALLWVLYDTGMKVSEVCGLRRGDVNVEQGTLMVRSKHFKSRRLTLGQQAAQAVRVYVERYRHGGSKGGAQQMGTGEVPLFLSETGHALTTSGVMTLFVRLRRRAGLSREEMGPMLIRDSFALRYLQAGGMCSRCVTCWGSRRVPQSNGI